MTENNDRIERTLEVLLYAPLGFGLFLRDTAPTFINMFISRGRAEVDRRQTEVQQHVTTARSLGQVTMAYAPPIVRERVARTVADTRRRAETLLGPSAPAPAPADGVAGMADIADAPASFDAPTAPPRPDDVTTTTPVDPAEPAASGGMAANGDPARTAGLPIPGYDALSASQVVERLVGLPPEELDAVHRYESSHRQRRTILGKIERLGG
jgi:hypothetical protein